MAPRSSSTPASSTCCVADGRVTGVRTDAGDIEAEIVVNCAGQWAKAVGALAGVNVPLHSAEHFYVVTDPFEGVHPDLPVLRDPDGYTYFKEEVGGLVVGGFEPDAKPWVSPDEIPYPFEFALLEEDWDHFSVLMDNAMLRIPVLEETGIRKFYNGPESFTPDNQFILGEAPEVRNFFVGAGFNSVGIASAGGAGRALAEWIVEGQPTMDLTGVDIRRFAPLQRQQPVAARPRRRGARAALLDPLAQPRDAHGPAVPSLPRLRRPGAAPTRTSAAGWAGSAPTSSPLRASRPRSSTRGASRTGCPGRPPSRRTPATNVTVFDQTSFSKLRLVGPDAEAVLQWLCTADVAVPVGRTVYTGMLNERGTYESDVTLTRTGDEEFLIVSSSATTERDKDHIGRRIGSHRATLVDVTSSYAVLGVMGPRSRELLSRLTRADLGDDAFPFGTSQEISLGYSTVRATRITYVGELGWELYVPTEFAVGVYEDLFRVGEDLGVVNGGYYAIESMRLEKGYRAFGRELTPDVHAGRGGAAVHLQAGDRRRLPRPLGRREDQGRRSATAAGLLRGRGPRADALGRRAGAARRRADRSGGLGRLGRDARRLRRTRLRLVAEG